jgi:hypothetical protein
MAGRDCGQLPGQFFATLRKWRTSLQREKKTKARRVGIKGFHERI